MANNPISIELQTFLARYIRSVEQLEILCLLVESSTKAWSEGEVFQRIQSSQESVANNLRHFTHVGLLIFDEIYGYRYSPETPELAQMASSLVKTYRERRVTIVEAIYLLPSDPIRQFADAFKIRKDKK